MKKLFLVAFIALSTTVLVAQDNIQPIPIGSSIPKADVKMKSVNGKEYSIKDVTGRNGVLVMFSCNTCPYVVKYQSRTLEAVKEAQQNGFGVIIINSNEDYRDGDDSYNAMVQYAKAQPYNYIPYVVDVNSVVANAFGATRTPETFLFNAKGQLIYHGAMDDNQDASQAKRKHLATAINETISGKEVSVKNTRSVGCSIKRKA
ncbi:MAG TPA: thioredoxin family protein [Segetibacter sp.]|jgi:thioredoxin-related protein